MAAMNLNQSDLKGSAPNSQAGVSRRMLLTAGSLAGAGILCRSAFGGRQPSPANAAETPAGPASQAGTAGPRRVLRFAHPTDIHVQPELRGSEGMAACFTHMMALGDRPELIITGGDLPMDTGSTGEARSKVEWDLFKKVLAERIPANVKVEHTLGNHDIFGRDKLASQTTGSESLYGKRWFLENFGYASTYRSFDRAGWHFVILDSINWVGLGPEYDARITGQQLEWLRGDLAATPATTPIVIVSHVPILSVANFFDKDDSAWASEGPDLAISTRRMHADCRDLDALFQKHPNVKLCLSGHLHLLDRCVYNGVTHICDGAVSGAKWRGPKRQTPEGYGLIDLYSDGTFDHRYTTFGWQAEKTVKAPKAPKLEKPAGDRAKEAAE